MHIFPKRNKQRGGATAQNSPILCAALGCFAQALGNETLLRQRLVRIVAEMASRAQALRRRASAHMQDDARQTWGLPADRFVIILSKNPAWLDGAGGGHQAHVFACFCLSIFASIPLSSKGVPVLNCLGLRGRPCPTTLHLHPDFRRSCDDCHGVVCTRMREKRLDDVGNALPDWDRPQCQARTRSHSLCKNKVIPGKRRCKFHGGLSTGPKTEAGKAKIAEAQRLRWQRFRLKRD